VTDADRAHFGGRSGATESADKVGTIDTLHAILGRTYAAAPERLVEERRADAAIAEADTLLLTVLNQLGVAYCALAIEAVLTDVAPALRWRSELAEAWAVPGS
jgi:hypothetical protein